MVSVSCDLKTLIALAAFKLSCTKGVYPQNV